jgi:hypothetical protein
MPVRVIITGSRDWSCRVLAEQIVNRLVDSYGADLIVVHGDALGVDRAFRDACRAAGVAEEPHPANWMDFGNSAGPRRAGGGVLSRVQSGHQGESRDIRLCPEGVARRD